MSLQPRHKLLLGIASTIFVLHLGVAAFVKPSFQLTMFGDALPCGLLVVAILAVRENFRFQRAVLPLFWKLMAAGLFQMLLSQAYWFYYDSLHRYSTPSPVIGDTLFLLAHVFFLSAFVLRPHSASAGRDMRLRHLDFALLTFWWLALYGYFALPWQIVIQDFTKYNPAYYLLALIQHLMIITGLAVVWKRSSRAVAHFLRQLYLLVCADRQQQICCTAWLSITAFIIPAVFTIRPSCFRLLLVTVVATFGPSLKPDEDKTPNREINQSLWTARIAMVAILSLPVIALFGSFEQNVPEEVAAFRLRAGVCGDAALERPGFLEADSACQGTAPPGASLPDFAGKSEIRAGADYPFAEAGRAGTACGRRYARDQQSAHCHSWLLGTADGHPIVVPTGSRKRPDYSETGAPGAGCREQPAQFVAKSRFFASDFRGRTE